MKNIIQQIQNKLTTDVKTLKYVDQDWGQMDFYTQPPVKFPCALIDIQSAEYTNDGTLIQQGVATVVIRLFDLKLSNSSNGAPQLQKDNAKKIWQLLEDTNKALHGQPFLEGAGLLIRQQMRRTKRNDGCYQTELYYTVQFTDDSCMPTYQKAPVTPVLHVSLQQ
jgi:hypothetical protein